MSNTATATDPPDNPGRGLLWLGLLVGLLVPLVYAAQVQARWLSAPWYMPILGTLAVGLVIYALIQRRSFVRFLVLGLLGLLATGEWAMVVGTRLPAYTGPMAVGKPFPAFAAVRADGTPFTEADFRGPGRTILVFFRGRW